MSFLWERLVYPKCENCGEEIRSEYMYLIDNRTYCTDCIEETKTDVEDWAFGQYIANEEEKGLNY